MDILKNWLYILVEDIERGYYFAALSDIERVKRHLIEVAEDEREKRLRNAQ